MPRLKSFLWLLPVVALTVLVIGCGSNSTGPQTKPSAYAGTYKGIVDGAGTSGTATITVGQVSSDVARGPDLHPESSNSVTVTLATNSGSITLTGTISGATATVTSTSPAASCTITFTTTGASGSCTEVPYGTLDLIAFVIVNGIEATPYCGTQSAGAIATINPTATLGAVVSGSNMYLVVAPATGTPVLYNGTLASNSVSLTSTSSSEVYSGTVSGTASISGTITGGGSGSWSVVNPCTQGALTVSTNAVPASATVGSTTTITPTPVTISNGGGSGTLGVLGVGTPTYTSAPSGWLQATLSSATTTSGTLSLSVTPPSGIAAGSYMASVAVTASLGTGSPQMVTVTLTVAAASQLTITLTSPLAGAVDLIPYSDQLTATGGAAAITWSLASGSSLPSWLTLTAGGLLSGTAPVGAVYPANAPLTFSVTATDGATSSTKQFQITVFANVTIASTSPLPSAQFTVPYSYQFTATGGPTSNYGWSVPPGSSLPSWLSLTSSGVLSGTPPTGTATPVTFNIAVASGGSTNGKAFTLAIQTIAPVAITTLSIPSPATVGVAYGPVQLMASGGPTPANYAWALSAGSSLLPAGLMLSTSGVISGTPTTAVPAPGASFSITVADGGGAFTAEQAYTLVVSPATSACTITTSPTLPTLTVGTVADVLLTTTGACPTTGTNSWTVTNGSLPAGLAIPLGGTLPEIYGAPTASGGYGSFTVNLINSGVVASETFNSGTVLAATVCEIGPNPEPNGTAGQLYAQGFVASNNCTTASDNSSLWSWGVSTGLPPGLTFDNPIVGVKDVGLTGTPDAGDAGKTYTFTVTFTNANQVGGHNEASATQVYTMTIEFGAERRQGQNGGDASRITVT